jgi:uncharacterized protein
MKSIPNRLIVFTKYPEVGKTKTRLIPALGADGAAKLQRQMTEHTLEQVKLLQVARTLSIEIHYSGGDRDHLQRWLGRDHTLRAQVGNDLGERMKHAFEQSSCSGASRTIIIGSDCPSLNHTMIADAFDELANHDLVIGPANDGGYYLIGLKSPRPEIFENIHWGTDIVFDQTMDRAAKLGLSTSTLQPLNDIDRPADLKILEEAISSPTNSRPKISIIIPTLNEELNIGKTISSALQFPGAEIIVVDGGSGDGTLDAVKQYDVITLQTPPGRSVQMNAGAKRSNGDILLFLHADSLLPDKYEHCIYDTLALNNISAGAFKFKLDDRSNGLKIVEYLANWRSRYLQKPYGDQGIFIRRDLFDMLDGFPNLPIMEEYEFIKRAGRFGKILTAPAPVITSSRRWKQLGLFKATLINQLIIIGYIMGIDPDRLARWYRPKR